MLISMKQIQKHLQGDDHSKDDSIHKKKSMKIVPPNMLDLKSIIVTPFNEIEPVAAGPSSVQVVGTAAAALPPPAASAPQIFEDAIASQIFKEVQQEGKTADDDGAVHDKSPKREKCKPEIVIEAALMER